MCQNAPFQWIRYFSSFSLIPTSILIIFTLWIHSGAQRAHFICRIHLFEHFTNLHVWTENLIYFHRSVIWADNCQILSFISNKAFHFSAFPSWDAQFSTSDHFCFKNYRFRKICQNVIFGPPWPQNARECFAPLVPYRKRQPRQTWRPQPGNQIQTACRAQMAWPGPTRLVSYEHAALVFRRIS